MGNFVLPGEMSLEGVVHFATVYVCEANSADVQ